MEDLRGKRKRKAPNCPNPLFVHWLTEWKNDAADKGLKTQYVYGKALKTLLKYPLAFETGKACAILENFGAKICDMLDKKLDEYVSLYGTTEPLPGVIDEKLCRLAQGKPKAKKARTATAKKSPDQANGMPGGVTGPQRKTPKKNPQYMPKYRSGPYALILTLHVKLKDGVPWMSKRDIMIEAQPLADASFTVPDPGSRYTAWSSMGSLITKGYVFKEGNPPRYGLSEEGRALAQKVSCHRYEEDEEEEEEEVEVISERYFNKSQEAAPSLPSTASLQSPRSTYHASGSDTWSSPSSRKENHRPVTKPPVHALSDSEDDDLPISIPLAARLASENVRTGNAITSLQRSPTPPPPLVSSSSGDFQFSFIGESGTEVTSKDAAAVTVDEVVSVGFKIKCDYNDLISSGKRYTMLPGRSCNNAVTAFVHNDDIPEVCPEKTPVFNPPIAGPTTSSHVAPAATNPVKRKSPPPPRTKSPPLPRTTSGYNPRPPSNPTTSAESARITKPISRPAQYSAAHENNSQESLHSLQSLSQGSEASCSSELSNPDFQFLPGTFEIVLCIDNHEQYGKGKFNKKALENELDRNGISHDVRLLQVGDFLWIARQKGYRLDAGQNQELVLDYVIERKRIDDMASSIIDGRFKEQKFRLKSCGLGVPMLLVEDCPNSYCSIPHKTLMQAAANTQVIDKFQIVKTKDLKDSFNFLINMTKFLQKTYQYKTLKAHSKVDLQSNNIVNNPEDREVRLMTFPDFNKASAKVKPLSVKEAFARQLVCIHGITPEKVAVILADYPTPASLRNAYKDCDSETEKENLLSVLKMPKTNKRVVMPQVSKHIYQMIMGISQDS